MSTPPTIDCVVLSIFRLFCRPVSSLLILYQNGDFVIMFLSKDKRKKKQDDDQRKQEQTMERIKEEKKTRQKKAQSQVKETVRHNGTNNLKHNPHSIVYRVRTTNIVTRIIIRRSSHFTPPQDYKPRSVNETIFYEPQQVASDTDSQDIEFHAITNQSLVDGYKAAHDDPLMGSHRRPIDADHWQKGKIKDKKQATLFHMKFVKKKDKSNEKSHKSNHKENFVKQKGTSNEKSHTSKDTENIAKKKDKSNVKRRTGKQEDVIELSD